MWVILSTGIPALKGDIILLVLISPTKMLTCKFSERILDREQSLAGQ